jgi:uncharacterized protein YraI
MPEWRELATELAEQEGPLVEQYEELARSAPGGTARKLAQHMMANQRFQLATLEVLQGEIPDEFECFGVVTHDSVNVREGPGANFVQITEADRGCRLIIRYFDGFWAAVQFGDGRQGFIFKDYVKCELGV